MSNHNLLYAIIGALVIALGFAAYQIYEDRRQPEGVQINLGPNGLSVKGK